VALDDARITQGAVPGHAGLIALVLRAAGTPDAWSESSRWWIHAVLSANLVSIALLVKLLRQEGGRLADLLRFDRRTF
jgi:hypothetical protein